ncbi:MAG TPA: P1 family peptidase [Candidatus Limnocylindrales bacterium]|nr:P1 family peptidase [Candidatus Limnocylindrales bacterium]
MIAGFRIGHFTLPGGSSGCTVVIPPPRNVAAYDMRGSSPGSRELASLDLERRATEVHAIVLTGGSAFGLTVADGVMAWLEQRGVGYRTDVATIPIVPAAVIFDRGAAPGEARPTPGWGSAACDAAAQVLPPGGRVGAGAGATVGKWAGREFRVAGGLGVATAADGDARLAALAVVNAFGDVIDSDGQVLAGTSAPQPRFRHPTVPPAVGAPLNTVLGIVMTAGRFDKSQVRFLAARGSDGVTRSVRPAHTRYDGDVTFAVAAPPAEGAPPVDLDLLGVLAADAMAAAVRNAVRPA